MTVIFTLDYELHGNGEGCPYELIVEPTDRLLRLFDRFGAKLTVMADIAEILKFRDYAAEHGKDTYHYSKIVEQLQRAVRTGHDVQLHIHSSWFNARHDGGWVQDWSEYDFAGLPPERLDHVIRTGKEFLESILRPVKPDYRCFAFRAANWSVSPSSNVVQALETNGLTIDTSVFKYGQRSGLVTFDYTSAHSEMLPWRADPSALWRAHPAGRVWEVPIYCERRWIGAFLTPNRVYRVLLGRFHRVPSARPEAPSREPASPGPRSARLAGYMGRHAWKADFNQCTGRQLTRALIRGEKRYGSREATAPFVLIGHSKLFTRMNERSLRPFLSYVHAHPARFRFGDFDSLKLPALGAAR